MNTLDGILRILSIVVRALGALTFGVTGGWFTWKAFGFNEGTWQLKAVVYGVFFVFIALLTRFTSPGALGAFLLGVSGAFVYWGMIANKKGEEESKE